MIAEQTSLRPTASGGRLVSGTTPHGDYTFEVYHDHDGPLFDANGVQVCTLKMVIKTPAPPVLADEQKQLAAARHRACEACPAHTDLTDTTVECRRRYWCRGKYDLLNPDNQCPEGRWNDTGTPAAEP